MINIDTRQYKALIKLPPEAIVQAYGFTFAGTCNCNGGFNKKYQRDKYLIYLTSTKFKVKLNGTTVQEYTSIDKLEAYLQKTFQELPAGK